MALGMLEDQVLGGCPGPLYCGPKRTRRGRARGLAAALGSPFEERQARGEAPPPASCVGAQGTECAQGASAQPAPAASRRLARTGRHGGEVGHLKRGAAQRPARTRTPLGRRSGHKQHCPQATGNGPRSERRCMVGHASCRRAFIRRGVGGTPASLAAAAAAPAAAPPPSRSWSSGGGQWRRSRPQGGLAVGRCAPGRPAGCYDWHKGAWGQVRQVSAEGKRCSRAAARAGAADPRRWRGRRASRRAGVA